MFGGVAVGNGASVGTGVGVGVDVADGAGSGVCVESAIGWEQLASSTPPLAAMLDFKN